MTRTARKVALLWRGNRDARKAAILEKSHLRGVAEALSRIGIEAEPAVYADELVDEVRDQLLKVDGVLVWVNPTAKDGDRSILDHMLRQVADNGVFVSTHPGIIQKMGTKEVLYRTRDMSWGCDTHLYTTAEEFRERLPRRLAEMKKGIGVNATHLTLAVLPWPPSLAGSINAVQFRYPAE